MSQFKYNIGDPVIAKAGVSEVLLQARMGFPAYPRVMTITGRVLEECSAGPQPNYRCASAGAVMSCHEVELIPVEEFDCDAVAAAYMAAKKKFRSED